MHVYELFQMLLDTPYSSAKHVAFAPPCRIRLNEDAEDPGVSQPRRFTPILRQPFCVTLYPACRQGATVINFTRLYITLTKHATWCCGATRDTDNSMDDGWIMAAEQRLRVLEATNPSTDRHRGGQSSGSGGAMSARQGSRFEGP